MEKTLSEILKEKSLRYVEMAFSSKEKSLLIGFGLCWFLQSSSVTVSLILPMVLTNAVDLNRVYYYSLGAALGTTCDPGQILSYIKFGPIGLLAGMIHFLLNFFGVLIFTLIPGLNRLPILLAKFLGNLISRKKEGPIYLILYALSLFIFVPLGIILI